MKKLKSILSLFAVVTAIACVFTMTGCSSSKDWAKATWEDYNPTEFLSKEDVVYALGEYEDTSAIDQYWNWCPSYIMLYKDGSVAGFGCFNAKSLFDQFNPVVGIDAYDSNRIKTAYYGSWSQSGNDVKITLTGLKLGSYYENGQPKADVTFDDAAMTFTYEATVEDGVITLTDFQAVDDNGTISYPIQSKSPAEYATLQAFVDHFPDEAQQ